MYKKTIIEVIITIGVAFLSLMLVFSFAEKPNTSKNGFNRSMIQSDIKLIHIDKLASPVKQFLGSTDTQFFFTSANPRTIFVTDYILSKIDSIYVPFPLNESILNNYRVSGTTPFFVIFAGNISSVISYKIGEKSAHVKKLIPPLFTSAVMISSGNYILKSFDSSRSNQLFEKVDSSSGTTVGQNNIFGKQDDGGFSLDGALRYNSDKESLIFLQYYQNKIYCLDTNLKVKYVKNTIDTTNTNTVATQALPIDNSKASLASKVPLKPIYSDFSVNNKNIFILSRLKADNEDQNNFRENSVIDVYDLSDGSYRFSFYIPTMEGKKATHLLAHKNTLIASYGNAISAFDLTEILASTYN